jgi:GNAT superfamily N-acetyltransferase
MPPAEPTATGAEPGAPERAPYEVRACRREDEDAILALLAVTVGETEASRKTADFWHWKHARNPFGRSYTVAAFEPGSGRMAGLRTLMWWRMRAPDGTLHRAVRPVDTATHPDHQRRGIFSSLTRAALAEVRARGAAFVFNTPNRNSLPGYLKMGWRVVARWPLHVRPSRPLAVAGRLLARRLAPGTRPVHGPVLGNLIPWSEFRAKHGDAFAELVALHEANRTHVGYRTVRDVPYLDWRYGEQPNIGYGVFAVSSDAGLEGIAIARVAPGIAGLEALVVTEVFLRAPTPAAGARLLRRLARHTTSDYLVAHFSRGTRERRMLVRAGFLPAPGRGYTHAALSLNDVPLDPVRPGSWDLSLGELEIF